MIPYSEISKYTNITVSRKPWVFYLKSKLTFSNEEVTEQSLQVRVVWLVLEPQRSAIMKIRHEFWWIRFAKHLYTVFTQQYWFSKAISKQYKSRIQLRTFTSQSIVISLNRSTSIGVSIFFSAILSYFCFFVPAFSPCQGRLQSEWLKQCEIFAR